MNTVLVALSLDGGAISDRLTAREISLFLRLAGPGPVWTDLPCFKKQRGVRHAPRRELQRRAQEEPLRVLGSPQLNAALLAVATPCRLLIWWRAELSHGTRRALVPVGTPFRRFRLLSLRRLQGEPVGVYER